MCENQTLLNRSVWHEQQNKFVELHGFYCGVEDLLCRIQEMFISIPENLGRDVAEVQGYQVKHEALDNELHTLQAQVSQRYIIQSTTTYYLSQ